MSSIFNYELLINDVFYRGWHILEYIENHCDMDELEREAVCATIMQALVEKKLINPRAQSLDFNSLSIVDDTNHFIYEEKPRICGFPLWLKEKMRHKSVKISAGLPVSLFCAKPPSKSVRFCVYDQNFAISSVFDSFTIYDAIYDSPTRNIRLQETRPFIETTIYGEQYLIDTLTKRIIKSSWFKEKYNFEAHYTLSSKDFDFDQKKQYHDMTSGADNLPEILSFASTFNDAYGSLKIPNLAEYEYEKEMTKKTYPDAWIKCQLLNEERDNFFKNKF